ARPRDRHRGDAWLQPGRHGGPVLPSQGDGAEARLRRGAARPAGAAGRSVGRGVSPPSAGSVPIHDVVVIGAGPAGLAAAATLRQHGIDPMVLDRAEEVGSSWRGRYDRLLLNSTRRVSHLPGLPFPPGPRWPSRDEV